MRDGIQGWARAFYPTVLDEQTVLHPLMRCSNSNFAECIINEADARRLNMPAFVDFRDKAKFEKHHVKDARHVDYDNMFSKPMMEELNKRNSLIIIHDVPEVAGAIALTLKVMDYPNVYILE
ncbi:MAG: rhodanese-like domain-containing protein [Desulfobacterales bacterium]